MNQITHTGIISKKGLNNVFVDLVDGTECSSCSLKGACGVADVKEESLIIQNNDDIFQHGDIVKVQMSHQMAFSALFWAYIFPFIILLASVIVLSYFYSEGVAGLVSLSFVLIYYTIIYFNKNIFNKKFQLKIKHL